MRMQSYELNSMLREAFYFNDQVEIYTYTAWRWEPKTADSNLRVSQQMNHKLRRIQASSDTFFNFFN